MPNTLLTPTLVAQTALDILENNLVFGNLVYRDYSGEFGYSGSTVNVRKPATLTASAWNGSTVSAQAVTETAVPVVMDTVPDVTVNVTSKDWELNVKDFASQIVKPAAVAIAQYMDAMIAGCYMDFWATQAVTSTTTIGDFATIGKLLSDNKVPFNDRYLVLNTTNQAKYIQLPSILNAEKSGSTGALREASMGRILGLDTYMDQNIKTHVSGTLTTGNASGTAGDDFCSVASASAATATLKKGDVFTVAGDTQQYVVTANAAATSSAIAKLEIWPALKTSPSTAAITIVSVAGANSMAFHKNAIALVTRPLAPTQSGNKSATMSMNGLSVRATWGYSLDTKSDTISFDLLCGVKTLSPELGVRLVG